MKLKCMSAPPKKQLPAMETCPICLDEIRTQAVTKCMHVFCRTCLDLALATGGPAAADGREGFFQPVCPLCRTPQGEPRKEPRALAHARSRARDTGDSTISLPNATLLRMVAGIRELDDRARALPDATFERMVAGIRRELDDRARRSVIQDEIDDAIDFGDSIIAEIDSFIDEIDSIIDFADDAIDETANARPPRPRRDLVSGNWTWNNRPWTRAFQLALSTYIIVHTAFVSASWKREAYFSR